MTHTFACIHMCTKHNHRNVIFTILSFLGVYCVESRRPWADEARVDGCSNLSHPSILCLPSLPTSKSKSLGWKLWPIAELRPAKLLLLTEIYCVFYCYIYTDNMFIQLCTYTCKYVCFVVCVYICSTFTTSTPSLLPPPPQMRSRSLTPTSPSSARTFS